MATSPWEGNWQVENGVANLNLAPDAPGNTFTTCVAPGDGGGSILTFNAASAVWDQRSFPFTVLDTCISGDVEDHVGTTDCHHFTLKLDMSGPTKKLTCQLKARGPLDGDGGSWTANDHPPAHFHHHGGRPDEEAAGA